MNQQPEDGKASVDVLQVNKLTISEEERALVSRFTGSYFPNEIDWNLIMPVVEKIENSADQKTGHIEITITENWCRMFQYSHKEFIKSYDGKSKINAVWQAVVQFITWYNTQTKKQ